MSALRAPTFPGATHEMLPERDGEIKSVVGHVVFPCPWRFAGPMDTPALMAYVEARLVHSMLVEAILVH